MSSNPLSQAVEDYVKTIYHLQMGSSEEGASTSAIARALKVTAPSVTNMIKRLHDLKLVNYTSHRGVTLTEAGRKVALEIIRHHRLLELYLHEVMGYSWDKVHDEAEYLEHHISEEFEDRIAKMLGDPTHDPHGHPIPTKEGHLPPSPGESLANTAVGETVVVKRVSDANSEMLRYLADLGLVPNAKLKVTAKAPFNGPITLKLGKHEQVIGNEVAQLISVYHE